MSGSQGGSLDLPEYAGIQASRALKASLLEALASSDAVEVSSASVLDADVSTVQMLFAAHQFALTQNKRLQLAQPLSGAVRDVLQSAGFLEDPSPTSRAFWMHEGTGE